MEISKFKLQDTLLDLKDTTARQLIDDVQTIAERAEGKADNAQTVADRAEGKADDAQAVADRAEGKADRAEGKADDALAGLAGKQKDLNNDAFTGNINILYGDSNYNGYYFINSSTASGTLPGTGYHMLLVFGRLQIAINVTTASRYLYVRYYANNAWNDWRKVQLTT